MTKPVIQPEALSLHTAILGMTGAGKTNTTKVGIEQVVAEGARVCILDPIKSDWWGLTSSADGKKPGLPFHILGGPRGHVPLHSGAGAAIGQLVAKGTLRHSIIDMAQFEPGGQVRFFADFIPVLLRDMRGFIYLVMEEAHMFAPKEKGGVGNENMSTHWAKMAATAGRSKGIRLIVATQRTQALHNAILGSCQTLIAHNLSSPADQEPVLKWLKAHVRDAKVRAEVADSLASLDTGEAWLCSGQAGIFERKQFPLASTYDNTATPTDDDTEHDVTTAAVDRNALLSIIGDAVKQAEANDPEVLAEKLTTAEKRIAEFERGAPTAAAPDAEAIQRARTDGWLCAHHALKDAREQLAWLEQKGLETIQAARTTIEAYLEITEAPPSLPEYAGPAPRETVAPGVDTFKSYHRPKREYARNDEDHAQPPLKTAPPEPKYAPGPRTNSEEPSRSSSRAPRQRILNALAWLEAAGIAPASRIQVGLAAGYSASSSNFSNIISAARTAGLIDYPKEGMLALTEAGRAAAEKPKAKLTTSDLHDALQRMLGAPKWRVLKTLIDAFPEAITRAALAQRSGYSAESSNFSNIVSSLRSPGFVDYPESGKVVALPVLFLRGKK